MTNLLRDKNIIIMGLRNKWSIAWGIACEARNSGANLIFTYQGEREKDGVMELIDEIKGSRAVKCDISSDEDIDLAFDNIKKEYGEIHGLVHSIAHAKREDIQNDFINTSREGFAHAMNISAYSLIAVSRKVKSFMGDGGSIITLSYMGSERVFPGYNVMGVAKAALEANVRYLAFDLGKEGIRVNAISAGPIKTISAKAVKDFSQLQDKVEKIAPLKRGINQDDLGRAALFLLSGLSSGITGEIMYVDCGYNIMGV